MRQLARRLPAVSDFARPHVEPEPDDDATYEDPQRPPSRPSLMNRVKLEQLKHSENAQTARRSMWWNGLTGWACMIAAFFSLPWHLTTIAWFAAVAFWALAFSQWMTFIVDRKAARMYPDPEDVASFN
jgi:hypothetical protein